MDKVDDKLLFIEEFANKIVGDGVLDVPHNLCISNRSSGRPTPTISYYNLTAKQ